MLLIPPLDHGRRRRLPRRRHPARRLRARRRLAARRARARSASARSSATPAWPRPGRKVPKQALVAVLSAAPRRDEGQGRHVVAGQPAAPSCAASATTVDDSRTYAPPRRLRVAPRPGRAVPAGAGHGRTSLLVVLVVAALHGLLDRGPWWAVLLGGPVLMRRAALVAAGVTTLAKWLLVGRMRASRAPAVELVRLAQRAGRHLRRGRRGAVVRPRRHRHAGAQPLAAVAGRQDRPRGVVRDLLAPRGRPHRPARRRHRQPGLRRADPPVPRPRPDAWTVSPLPTAGPSDRTA